jgi:hypothetical protein
MSELVLYKNLMLLGSGVEACLEKKLTGPALILLYSAIDTAGWLDSPEKDATRESFIKWVDDYLLKAKPLGCTSLDLYAARCGLLHTFSPDSRLSFKGKARRICYAWGTASVQDLQRTIDLTNKFTEYVAVHVNDLYEGWRIGLLAFTQDLEDDPTRKTRVYEKTSNFFSELGWETVCKAITKLKKNNSA